jgi:hypothetical protein
MTLNTIRLAAAGAVALALPALSGAAAAGCPADFGYVAVGHYPTITPPAALYQPPPSPIARRRVVYDPYVYEPYVAYRPVSHIETTTVLAPVTRLEPVRIRRSVTHYRRTTIYRPSLAPGY